MSTCGYINKKVGHAERWSAEVVDRGQAAEESDMGTIIRDTAMSDTMVSLPGHAAMPGAIVTYCLRHAEMTAAVGTSIRHAAMPAPMGT